MPKFQLLADTERGKYFLEIDGRRVDLTSHLHPEGPNPRAREAITVGECVRIVGAENAPWWEGKHRPRYILDIYYQKEDSKLGTEILVDGGMWYATLTPGVWKDQPHVRVPLNELECWPWSERPCTTLPDPREVSDVEND